VKQYLTIWINQIRNGKLRGDLIDVFKTIIKGYHDICEDINSVRLNNAKYSFTNRVVNE